jgi:hypothetical protein
LLNLEAELLKNADYFTVLVHLLEVLELSWGEREF